MISLGLQLLAALGTLALGVVGLAAARHRDALGPRNALGWAIVGSGFLLNGLSETFQSTAAVFAYRAGPGSALWDGFLFWAPLANHSRSGVELGMFTALALLAVGRWSLVPVRRSALVAATLLFGGLAVGVAIGYFDADVGARHYAFIAIVNAGLACAAFITLTAALVTRSIDRYLWMILAAHALKSVLNVLWMSVLVTVINLESWPFATASWTPHPRHVKLIAVVIGAAMLGLALVRLRLARRGVHQGTLLEPLPPMRFSTLD